MKDDPAQFGTVTASRLKKRSTRVRRLEAQGLLIIAMLILAYTILRYWHNIPWSAR